MTYPFRNEVLAKHDPAMPPDLHNYRYVPPETPKATDAEGIIAQVVGFFVTILAITLVCTVLYFLANVPTPPVKGGGHHGGSNVTSWSK